MNKDLQPASLSSAARNSILLCAFLGWTMAGMQLGMTSLLNGPATAQMLRKELNLPEARPKGDIAPSPEEKKFKELKGSWFGYVTAAFLLGAAAGGWLFGQIGDMLGRTKAMGLSIMTFSVMSFFASTSNSTILFMVLRFGAGLGVGGMWPNGVSLVGEVWAHVRISLKTFVMDSRPIVAGVMGTAANVGITCQAQLARSIYDTSIDSEDWRRILVTFGTTPLLLGIFCFFLPESPKWLAARAQSNDDDGKDDPQPAAGMGEIFGSRYMRFTLIGIMLATIPLIGGWGSSNWVMRWADQTVAADKVRVDQGEEPQVDPKLKADLLLARSVTGTISSLLGGFIATMIGRKFCYFIVSIVALGVSQILFWAYTPADPMFFWWFAALGFFSGIYFGWLPLCLPELFPTRIRSAGAGVSFNFGRILTVVTIFITAALITQFNNDFALIGRITSLVYGFGILAIAFAPDTSQKAQLDD